MWGSVIDYWFGPILTVGKNKLNKSKTEYLTIFWKLKNIRLALLILDTVHKSWKKEIDEWLPPLIGENRCILLCKIICLFFQSVIFWFRKAFKNVQILVCWLECNYSSLYIGQFGWSRNFGASKPTQSATMVRKI